jgi:hypothetical protein
MYHFRVTDWLVEPGGLSTGGFTWFTWGRDHDGIWQGEWYSTSRSLNRAARRST